MQRQSKQKTDQIWKLFKSWERLAIFAKFYWKSSRSRCTIRRSEISGRVVINGITNSGYMLQCLRHLGKSEELIDSLDVVEQNAKEEEEIVVDRENPNCIVEYVRQTKNESQFFSGSKFCPPHLQMKFGIKNPPDPKLSSSIILPRSGDMCNIDSFQFEISLEPEISRCHDCDNMVLLILLSCFLLFCLSFDWSVTSTKIWKKKLFV